VSDRQRRSISPSSTLPLGFCAATVDTAGVTPSHRAQPGSDGAPTAALDPERLRLVEAHDGWKQWGPYVSERAWGTVREDYSADGQPWEYFPHDHARSRAYRWSEDGLGAICDTQQRLCLGFAFWNGKDPILKERIFGLTGDEGNHGEDAKEYWWYLDSTPTHSWMRWRYAYPQVAFPYDELVAENGRRGRDEPEFELFDTGVFEQDRYWEITADYAKASHDDIAILLTIRNAGPDAATLHVLPTLWFRNTWSWGLDDRTPTISFDDGCLAASHHSLGMTRLAADGDPTPLFCNNESNTQRLWNTEGDPFPKDGIGDHVLHGTPTVNPQRRGTKAALHYEIDVAAGGTAEIRLRLSRNATKVGPDFDELLARRAEEADQFYATLLPDTLGAESTMIARQALAGMLWSKQFYHYDVERWLDGDPSGVEAPASRLSGRNSGWRHLNNADVISMPDKWEYPWYAAWDLAFHCVALAAVDAEFAKNQLVLLCREWYMQPNGQLPAYEWEFGDVNPPVHAWAALRVFESDGSTDYAFLERVFHKLLLNFTWWVNRKDVEGNNVFEGGFLGLDNIGPIDRSAQLPIDGELEQSDGTAWMAMYCLNLLEMALVLAQHDQTYEDLATKFLEHFTYIANAMDRCGLWSDEDDFYYDVVQMPGAEPVPLRVRSMVGLLPLAATATLTNDMLRRLPDFASHFEWFLRQKPQHAANVVHNDVESFDGWLLSIVSPERLPKILRTMFDEDEFLSPFGLRSLAKSHRDAPFVLHLGALSASVGYEPGESRSGLFGGNSNWRGPIWFPLNYLLIESLLRFDRYLGDSFTIAYPTGDGAPSTLREVATDLSARLVSLFTDDPSGRRPLFGECDRFQHDPAWHGQLLFHEYFDGDTGCGLGASHQTGWTGLVANLIRNRGST